MDISIKVELPLPPRAKGTPTDNSGNAEDVIVNLLDGQTMMCQLVQFLDAENTIQLYFPAKDKVKSLSLDKVKNFQLVNSRHFTLDDEYSGMDRNQVSMPSERQEYHLSYNDGSEDDGETFGYVDGTCGLHFFISQAFYNYYHLFIPFSALEKHRIGMELGQALLETELLQEEELEEGLETQKALRDKKLGEYFTNEEILTPAQLEDALRRQQSTPNMKLGEALIQEKLVTQEQLNDALQQQQKDRSVPLGEILINMGIISKEDMKKTLAIKLGIPYINLRKFNVSKDAVNMVPQKIARRHHVLPLCLHELKLIVAVENPLNRTPLEDLRFHTKKFVEPVMASYDDIEWAFTQYYGSHINALALELEKDEEEEDETEIIAESDNTLVKIVNKMIMDAYEFGASDIHIEPYPGKGKTSIRFRKDGELSPYVELNPGYRNALVSRLKIMCDLDISERRKPQDGKINFKKFGPLNIELRVATIPTAGGVEDVVLRVLANSEPIPLDQMGIREEYLKNIKRLVKQPYGLFLVCGPTGSGKTTTLHSILGFINTPDKKIWTAEDPVEITQKGLRQLQVNSKINLSFANAMRAFLRADPDIIMVGEMRDEETAATGIEASLTGHLVLSTLHTNSAPESIVRLLDMGMDPFNFADALSGILAQRLAKRLCPSCKKSYEPERSEIRDLLQEYCVDSCSELEKEARQKRQKEIYEQWKQKYSRRGMLVLYKAMGCEECNQTGYEGRIPLHELLISSNEIKKLILEKATVAELSKVGFKQGMISLKQDGIEKILQGQTDIHQVRAVCVK